MIDSQELRNQFLGDVPPFESPVDWLAVWVSEAEQCGIEDPNAMILCTVDNLGRPGARVVLLKRILEEELVFFTNYQSRKAHDMMVSDRVAVVFYWRELERQIRVEGTVRKLSDDLSDEYFDSRPEGSKIGAWASPQSKSIPGREYLEDLRKTYEEQFKGEQIQRPPFWGGYRIQPEQIEFWKGRKDRLHDRIQFFKANGVWNYRRLAP